MCTQTQPPSIPLLPQSPCCVCVCVYSPLIQSLSCKDTVCLALSVYCLTSKTSHCIASLQLLLRYSPNYCLDVIFHQWTTYQSLWQRGDDAGVHLKCLCMLTRKAATYSLSSIQVGLSCKQVVKHSDTQSCCRWYHEHCSECPSEPRLASLQKGKWRPQNLPKLWFRPVL